jgi:hypothetical protein
MRILVFGRNIVERILRICTATQLYPHVEMSTMSEPDTGWYWAELLGGECRVHWKKGKRIKKLSRKGTDHFMSRARAAGWSCYGHHNGWFVTVSPWGDVYYL